MTRSELISLFLIVIFFLSLSYAVLKTAGEMREKVKTIKEDRFHLPSACSRYYNDGTDRWRDCMGVGLVPAPVGSASRVKGVPDGKEV